MMSSKNFVLDNNNINNIFEELIDSLTDYSRDTTNWLPPNERNANNIIMGDTDSINYILNAPICSRALVFVDQILPNENKVLIICSEKTHVSEPLELEQIDFPREFSDNDGTNSIILEVLSLIRTSTFNKRNKKNLKSVKNLIVCQFLVKEFKQIPAKLENVLTNFMKNLPMKSENRCFINFGD